MLVVRCAEVASQPRGLVRILRRLVTYFVHPVLLAYRQGAGPATRFGTSLGLSF